jgi:hypothetical protein
MKLGKYIHDFDFTGLLSIVCMKIPFQIVVETLNEWEN